MTEPQDRRVLRLQGATNFRDLGGYLGHDGRAVRWRKIFRSDHLARLTPQDEAQLAGLGLQRVLDFRGEQERAAMTGASGMRWSPARVALRDGRRRSASPWRG